LFNGNKKARSSEKRACVQSNNMAGNSSSNLACELLAVSVLAVRAPATGACDDKPVPCGPIKRRKRPPLDGKVLESTTFDSVIAGVASEMFDLSFRNLRATNSGFYDYAFRDLR